MKHISCKIMKKKKRIVILDRQSTSEVLLPT